MEEREHIDVIEDFIYDSANQQYNRDYLHWRRHTKEAFIYRFTDNIKENVYTAGGSGQRQSAAQAEEKSLVRCGELIGAVLLVFLVIEVIGETLLVGILTLFRIDIRLDFLTLTMNGSQWAVVGVRALITVLKYSIPAAILVRFCKMPQAIYVPAMPGALPESIAAAAAGMVIAGIYSLTAQNEGVEMAQLLFTYKDLAAVAAYGMFETLIGSILSEIFLRGGVLTLLRQFGDPFAIAVTAMIAFLFPNALPNRISEALIGLAAGYLLIRSGSIFKCVLLRITYAGLSYARLIVIYANHQMRLWEYALLLISFGTLTLAFFITVRHEHIRLHNRKTALSAPKKWLALAQSITMLPWAAVSLLLIPLQLFY